MSKRKPRAARQPPVSLGGIVKEDLPLPFVHYPKHYGTFFAFSEKENSTPYLCECSKPALVNYLGLRDKIEGADQNALYDQAAHLDKLHFPDSLSKRFASQENPLNALQFMKAICHRCNLVPPTMRYCHEMYGVTFIQYFGWYVDQAYLRFGILPRGVTYLEDVTPLEFVQDICEIVKARIVQSDASKWFREREEYTWQRIQDPSLPELEFVEVEIAKRQDTLREANKQARQAERVLSKKIENVVREEFGFRKVGERWTSETLLYTIISNLFPDLEILRHHRPDWLQGLELDIFIPDLGLALEYQGQQHFHPVEAWGGEEALIDLQERDQRKASICEDRGVTLITFDYTEPLIRGYVKKRIQDRLPL